MCNEYGWHEQGTLWKRFKVSVYVASSRSGELCWIRRLYGMILKDMVLKVGGLFGEEFVQKSERAVSKFVLSPASCYPNRWPSNAHLLIPSFRPRCSSLVSHYSRTRYAIPC